MKLIPADEDGSANIFSSEVFNKIAKFCELLLLILTVTVHISIGSFVVECFKKRFYYLTSLEKYFPTGFWNLMLKNASSFNSPNQWRTICNLWPPNVQCRQEAGQPLSNIQHTSKLNFLGTTFWIPKVARTHQSIKQKITTALMSKYFLVLMDNS